MLKEAGGSGGPDEYSMDIGNDGEQEENDEKKKNRLRRKKETWKL